MRVYPDGADPHQSSSKVDLYLDPTAADEIAKEFGFEGDINALLALRSESSARVIQNEDYVAAASGHRGMRSGAFEYVTFGRNEPASHRDHNSYREALGMPRLEVVADETPLQSLRAV